LIHGVGPIGSIFAGAEAGLGLIRTLTVERLRAARIPGDLTIWLKALLVAVLAVQVARLVWAAVTPVGPLGDWRPAGAAAMPPAAQAAVIAAVNPFDRQGAATVAQLPSDLKLFGVRAGAGSIPGGAIVGLPDGTQISVIVGEAVMPGVVLVGVGFDFADVDRQGTRQRLFIDQDRPPETLGPGGAPVGSGAAASAGPRGPLTANAVYEAVNFAPRQAGSGINGVTVSPVGSEAAFAALGFRPGDVIVAVNGARISSAADVDQLQQSLAPGASLTLTVERDGRQVPLTLNLAGSR